MRTNIREEMIERIPFSTTSAGIFLGKAMNSGGGPPWCAGGDGRIQLYPVLQSTVIYRFLNTSSEEKFLALNVLCFPKYLPIEIQQPGQETSPARLTDE
jgi:hypothetical protein